MSSKQAIANHNAVRRCVVMCGNVATDVTALRRTPSPNRSNYQTSYQNVRKGDTIISYDGSAFSVNECVRDDDPDSVRQLDEGESLDTITNLPALLREWLLDHGSKRHTNYIPIGYGWDGKFTRLEYSKRRLISIMFEPLHQGSSELDTEWLEDLLDDLCRTPSTLLITSWNDARRATSRLIPPCEPLIERELVIFKKDGTVSMFKQRKVISGLNKHPGTKLPDDVDRVIILDRKQFKTAHGERYGTAVDAIVFKD